MFKQPQPSTTCNDGGVVVTWPAEGAMVPMVLLAAIFDEAMILLLVGAMVFKFPAQPNRW
jgi:hypothetical protein